MNFKEIIESYGKQINVSFSVGSDDYSSGDVISANLRFDGALYTAVMRCLDIILDGKPDISKDDVISDFTFQCSYAGESKSINYGSFIVAEAPEYDEDANTTKLICYDFMYKACKEYAIHGRAYPCSLMAYLLHITTEIGITVANISALENASQEIPNEKFLNASSETGSSYTYRDALDDIAKCAGCSFAYKSDANGENTDELYIIYVTNGSGSMKTPLYTLDTSNLKSLTIGEHYGAADTVILARTPQEDNVYYPSSGNHNCEVKLCNAQLCDDSREDWTQGIYNKVRGTEYQCYELESYGLGYLNFGDVFEIETYAHTDNAIDYSSTVTYQSVFMRTDMMINDNISEKSVLEMPVATSTDYAAATTSEKAIKQIFLKVNKQDGIIQGLVSDVGGFRSEFNQTAREIVLQVYQEQQEQNLLANGYSCFENATLFARGNLEYASRTTGTDESAPSESYAKYSFKNNSSQTKECSFSFRDSADENLLNSIDLLEAGKKYTFSFYAKSNINKPFIILTSNNSMFSINTSRTYITYDESIENPALSQNWQKYEISFTLSESLTTVSNFTINFAFELSGNQTGEIYISKSSLIKEPDSDTYATKAELGLYVQKTDNNQIISMINASASQINLTANRLKITTPNFNLDGNGIIISKSGTIGGWNISETGLYKERKYIYDGEELSAGYTVLNTNNNVRAYGDNPAIVVGLPSIDNPNYDNALFVVDSFGDESGAAVNMRIGTASGNHIEIQENNIIWKTDSKNWYIQVTDDSFSIENLNRISIQDPDLSRLEFFTTDSMGNILRLTSYNNSTDQNTVFTITHNNDWSSSIGITSDYRTKIAVNHALIISANSGTNSLILEGSNIWLLGKLYFGNYKNVYSSKMPLYVNIDGEITV